MWRQQCRGSETASRTFNGGSSELGDVGPFPLFLVHIQNLAEFADSWTFSRSWGLWALLARRWGFNYGTAKALEEILGRRIRFWTAFDWQTGASVAAEMPPSPALRYSPSRKMESHKRGRSFESGLMFREKDEDLALFNDMNSRERDNFLIPCRNEDFDDSICNLLDFHLDF